MIALHSYAYKLKQLIDLACQRNMLFTYDGKEYGPLLKIPRAFVVYARGGTCAEDSPTPASGFDHQKGYIDFWLKFIGVKEDHTLVVEGTTWGGKEKGEEAIARGQKDKVGGRFLAAAALIAPEFSRPLHCRQRPLPILGVNACSLGTSAGANFSEKCLQGCEVGGCCRVGR
jgi:hypothetical protein